MSTRNECDTLDWRVYSVPSPLALWWHIDHGRILWGGVHLPCDRFAPPLGIFSPPLGIFSPPVKSHAPPLGKVSITDQSENLTFFGCLHFVRKFFCKIDSHSSLCQVYPFNAMF